MTTEEALEYSIEHWKENRQLHREGKPFRMDADSCELCRQFYDDDDARYCKRARSDGSIEHCPVAAEVGVWGCQDTPWPMLADLSRSGRDVVWAAFDESNREGAAQLIDEEVAFLESLRG